MNNETLKVQRQEMCMTQCLKAASKVSSKPKSSEQNYNLSNEKKNLKTCAIF